MSRFSSAASYGHRIRKNPLGGYRVSWTVDFYYKGSRLRHPRTFSRDVEDDGAARFCKKWGIELPSNDQIQGTPLAAVPCNAGLAGREDTK